MDRNTINKQQEEEFITIRDLLHICRINYVWFIVSLLITIGAASYYLFVTPNQYTREATILVNQEVIGKGVSSKDNNDFNDMALVQQTTNIYNVQSHLQSLDVIMEVVDRMNLASTNNTLKKAQSIQSRLKVDLQDDKSTIINMKYDDHMIEHAEKVLYNIVDVYNEKRIKEKQLMTQNTSDFIDERLKLLERDLNVVDDSISSFKSRHQITDIQNVSNLYLQQMSQSEAQILSISNQKAMVLFIRDILSDKQNAHQLLPTNTVVGNQQIESQIVQYNSLLMQYNNHLAYTSEQNPIVGNIEVQLTEMRDNIIKTIDNQVKALDIQLNSIRSYNGSTESKIASNPIQAKHLAAVERQQKVKESLYLYLLQKKEENLTAMSYTTQAIQMIDIPHGSDTPTSPNKRNIIFAALFLGLVVPVVILFIRENMNTTVRDRADIERRTLIPIIGEVPFDRRNLLPRTKYFWRARNTKQNIVVEENSRDIVNEAFRIIRSNMDFITESQDGKDTVYMITSAYTGSGKTFISMNLSVALSLNGKRVLLIDGDLRRAATSKFFGCTEKGITDYLTRKETDIHNVIVQHPRYESLNILAVGSIPPNPTELLSTELLSNMFETLRQDYDYIIIDCPPANAFADAAILEKFADRSLFVIRAGLFERNNITELDAAYKAGQYKNLSIILNDSMKNKVHKKYYGYYGYYGYMNSKDLI